MRKQSRKALFFPALLITAAFSLPALAEVDAESVTSAQVNVTDHLIFSNAEDPNDPSVARLNTFMHEATVRGEYNPYSLGVHFSNRYSPDAKGSAINKPFVLEKKTAALETGDWTVTLGDSHQELGRGIALSLYRDPVFGLDNTLEGASARFRPTDVEALAFAGRVNALKAPVAISPTETSLVRNELWLAGSSLTGHVAEGTKTGAHYLFGANRPLDSVRFDKYFHTIGGTVSQENIVEGVDVYLESNLLVINPITESELETSNGAGTYGSVTWSPSPWKAKLEVKDYRDFDFEFRRPPSLEEDIVESINISDVSAARAYAEHRDLATKTTYHASYLMGRDRLVNSVIHHGVLGTRFAGLGKLEFELRGGYRTLPGKSNLAHAAVKAKAKTLKGQAVELGLRKQVANINLDLRPALDDRNIADLTYTFSETFNVGLGYEFMPRNDPAIGSHFFNAGATFKTGALVSRAFIGKTSGGTLCSGGVCRQVPPYTGGLIETNYSF